MTYLLDTCVVSDFIKNEPNTVKKIQSVSPKDVLISSITVMEIMYGLALNPERTKSIKDAIQNFLEVVKIINFTREDAEHTAKIRAQLKKKGTPIGDYDLLLAGTADYRKLILVSSNMKEFNRIETLLLQNWRNPQ